MLICIWLNEIEKHDFVKIKKMTDILRTIGEPKL